MSCNSKDFGVRGESDEHNASQAFDLRKVRRRIEDRLKADNEAVIAAAVLLKVSDNSLRHKIVDRLRKDEVATMEAALLLKIKID